MAHDYTKLRELLKETETFPLPFTFKFIGKNTPAFQQSIQAFEKLFPELRKQRSNISANGHHLALTYQLEAQNAEEIIQVFQASERIQDIQVIL